MSDMWAAASKDIEAERKEKATAMAAVALGKFAPFLFEAKTKSEFTTRMALQQTKIAEALQDATEDEDARKAALDQMTSDFDEALGRREVEATKAKEEADRKAKVAKALDRRKASQPEVVYTSGTGRVVDMGEGNPLSPRYKIERNWGDESGEDWHFDSFSNSLDEAKTKVGHRRRSSVTYTVRANDRDKGSATGTGSSVGEALDALPPGFLPPVAFGRQTIIEDLEVTGKSTHGTTDFFVSLPHSAKAGARHLAVNDEIKAGDWIVARVALPDLRAVGAPKVMLTANRPQKVVKIETLEDAFETEWDRHGVVDAADIFEDWLGQDIPGRSYGNSLTNVWVAHLESGAIVPLEIQGAWSDKFPTRARTPQVPGQKSWNFAHRDERLPMRVRMAERQERLPLRIKMANPYSDANPYAKTPPAASEAPAPQVTVNVAPPNDDAPSVADNDDEERQRRARDKINQTQMTQDLTAARADLAVTLAKKILREHPGATQKQALRVAKATMDRHPALVSHALSRVASREPKESSPR